MLGQKNVSRHLIHRQRATYNHSSMRLAMHSNHMQGLFCIHLCPSYNAWSGIVCTPRLAWSQYRSSPLYHLFPSAIRFLMVSHRLLVSFLRSLYWRREIRFGISFTYSFNLANNRHSLSMPIASLTMESDTISRSLNLGTTPGRGILPCSFTKSFENSLHISRIFTKFVYKLCILIL